MAKPPKIETLLFDLNRELGTPLFWSHMTVIWQHFANDMSGLDDGRLKTLQGG